MVEKVEKRNDGTEVHFVDGILNYTTEKDGSKTYYNYGEHDICNITKDGFETHYEWGGVLDYSKDPKNADITLTRSWTKDKKGNVTTYYTLNGRGIKSTRDAKGNGKNYYPNGVVSAVIDEENNITSQYREDGTLESVWNVNTDTVTTYEADGKTVAQIEVGVRTITFEEGKVKGEYSIKYTNDGAMEKNVATNYDAGGKVDSWTVRKQKIEFGEYVGDETSKTYKRDDIKAIMSGDVPGYGFIDAHLQLSDDKGEPVWVKQAKEKADKKITAHKTDKKKQASKALKVQKEGQLMKGLKEKEITVQNGDFPWVADAQKKMSTKTTEQKSKAKKTTQKTNIKGRDRLS